MVGAECAGSAEAIGDCSEKGGLGKSDDDLTPAISFEPAIIRRQFEASSASLWC